MACVRKRRNRWVLDYQDQNGNRRWETLPKDSTRRNADALLSQRIREVGSGEYEARSDQKTFDELADAYLTGHVRVNVRETTAIDYEGNLRRHLKPFFTGVRIRLITPEMVEGFRSHLLQNGVGRRTVNKNHTLLSAMLRYAVRYRWLSYNPAAEVRKLRVEAPHQDKPEETSALSPLEIRRLLDATEEHWRPVILMAVSTGLRQGELLGLKWGDIDFHAKQVHVRRQFTGGQFSDLKTKHSRRRVGLADELISDLTRWKLRCPKGEHDLVFPNGAGNPENPSNLLKRGFYPALRRAKLRQIRFHDLRHTYASMLIARNMNVKAVQRLLGHASAMMTLDTYAHLWPENHDEATCHIGELVFGSKTVAVTETARGVKPQAVDKNGGPGRTRTCDLGIMSPQL